jgi:hypothetical protein
LVIVKVIGGVETVEKSPKVDLIRGDEENE